MPHWSAAVASMRAAATARRCRHIRRNRRVDHTSNRLIATSTTRTPNATAGRAGERRQQVDADAPASGRADRSRPARRRPCVVIDRVGEHRADHVSVVDPDDLVAAEHRAAVRSTRRAQPAGLVVDTGRHEVDIADIEVADIVVEVDIDQLAHLEPRQRSSGQLDHLEPTGSSVGLVEFPHELGVRHGRRGTPGRKRRSTGRVRRQRRGRRRGLGRWSLGWRQRHRRGVAGHETVALTFALLAPRSPGGGHAHHDGEGRGQARARGAHGRNPSGGTAVAGGDHGSLDVPDGACRRHTRPVGFNPYRKFVARRADYVFVVVAAISCFALVLWAFVG